MKFCSECGHPVEYRVPEGDNLPRAVCPQCGTVHYTNPNMVLGCVVEHGSALLLCKRSIEPRSGKWTVPAGFMENGETLEEAAMRETREEALAEVTLGGLLALVNVPQANQVHIFFRATLKDGKYGAGSETTDARLFEPDDIPWSEIAFPSVDFAIRRFLADRAAGSQQVHLTRSVRPKRFR